MNDDILRMARAAGFVIRDDEVMESDGYGIQTESVVRFAALVRADEREACAAICDTTPPHPFRPSIEAAHAIRARGKA